MELTRARLAAWGTALLIAVGPVMNASAQPDGDITEAKSRYARGVELYQEGSFEAALVEFERSYDLAANYRILRSIGLIHVELRNYVKAQMALEKYLADGGSAIPADKRRKVESHLRKLRARIGSIEIAVSQPGATISIDGTEVGTSPLAEPVSVNAGSRRITVSRTGYKPVNRTMAVGGAERVRVVIELEPAEDGGAGGMGAAGATGTAGGAIPPSGTGTEDDGVDDSGSGWTTIGWITTGVLAAGATVTGVMAMSASSKLKDKRENEPTPGNVLQDDADSTKQLALTSDILTGAAVVVGGITIISALSGGDGESAQEDDASEPLEPTSVDLRVGPTGFKVVGSF